MNDIYSSDIILPRPNTPADLQTILSAARFWIKCQYPALTKSRFTKEGWEMSLRTISLNIIQLFKNINTSILQIPNVPERPKIKIPETNGMPVRWFFWSTSQPCSTPWSNFKSAVWQSYQRLDLIQRSKTKFKNFQCQDLRWCYLRLNLIQDSGISLNIPILYHQKLSNASCTVQNSSVPSTAPLREDQQIQMNTN